MRTRVADILGVATRKVHFLHTNIGRGHPFYLDGIVEAMTRRGDMRLVRSQEDVFDISRGLARLGWRSARWLYEKGSSSNLVGRLYRHIRSENDYSRASLPLRLMGVDIRDKYSFDPDPVVVAHPILVGILAGRAGLIYQHGELVAPQESLVQGADTVFVPTDEVATAFRAAGYRREQVIVTGLCIEPSLVRQASDAFTARFARIDRHQSLTGAFFSSGAEPQRHVELLVRGALSAARYDGHAIIFAKRGGRLARETRFRAEHSRFGLRVINAGTPIPRELPRITLVEFNGRREETFFTAQYFPQFDYIVGPSHERSNWAMGLGLPMFMVEPCIGPFAPLNRAQLKEAGVAESISDMETARSLGVGIQRLRTSGRLQQMAVLGWKHHEINGFEKIADHLNRRFCG